MFKRKQQATLLKCYRYKYHTCLFIIFCCELVKIVKNTYSVEKWENRYGRAQ